MNRLLALCALGALTVPAVAGTAVGHPHPAEFAPGAGISYTFGAFPVDHIVYEHCDGTTELVQIDAVLDPVAGDPILIPPGTHCGAVVTLSGRLWVAGTGTAGGNFGLSLGVGSLSLDIDPPIVVPGDGSAGGTALRLGDDDWVTATLLSLDPGDNVFVGPNHPLHDQLRDAIRYDSELY